MYGVWIDRVKARVFRLDEGRFRFLLEAGGADAEAGFLKVGPGEPRFQRLAGELKSARQLILIGPDIVKHNFRTYLMEQFPALGRKVAAVKEADASVEIEAENLLDGINSELNRAKG